MILKCNVFASKLKIAKFSCAQGELCYHFFLVSCQGYFFESSVITKTICLVGSVYKSRIYKVRESTHCKSISYHNTETSVCFCYHCHRIKSFILLCSGEEFIASPQVFSGLLFFY